MNNIGHALNSFYENNILAFINIYRQSPAKLISLIIDTISIEMAHLMVIMTMVKDLLSSLRQY